MTTLIRDTEEAVRTVRDQTRARQVLGILRGRVEDARFIGWRLLEQSLRDELQRAEAAARERGFDV